MRQYFFLLILVESELIPKLHNWNSGRLYVGFSSSRKTYNYGTVCQGWVLFFQIEKVVERPYDLKFFSTGKTAINGANAQNFGRIICQKLGFSKLSFIGSKRQYSQFIKDFNLAEQSSVDDSLCIPDFLKRVPLDLIWSLF